MAEKRNLEIENDKDKDNAKKQKLSFEAIVDNSHKDNDNTKKQTLTDYQDSIVPVCNACHSVTPYTMIVCRNGHYTCLPCLHTAFEHKIFYDEDTVERLRDIIYCSDDTGE